MRKQYVLLLVGLIAFAGMMFTGCGPVEYEYTFENYTKETIVVTSKDFTPGSFELKGLSNILLDDPTTKTVTSEKSKPNFTFNVKGQSETYTRNNVQLDTRSTTYMFKPKDSGFANKLK